MTVNEVVQHVYRQTGKNPLANERSSGNLDADYSMLDSPSGAFSLDNIVEKIERAEDTIVKDVKGSHIQSLIKSATVSNYSGGDLISAANINIVRPLLSRVFYDSSGSRTRCNKKRAKTYKDLENAGRGATSSFPVVTYEAGEMQVYPQDSQDVEFFYIEEPDGLSVPTSSAYDTFVTSGTDNSNILHVEDRLRKAVVAYVASEIYQELKSSSMSKFMDSIYQDEILAYKRGTQTSVFDTDEVNTE